MGTAFVVFFGTAASSPIEERLDEVRRAIGAHVVGLARRAAFAPVLAVTDDPAASERFAAAGAHVAAPRTRPFHLGRELRDLVVEHRLERVCTIGAGAGALVGAEDLVALRERLERGDDVVVSNNYYSADLVGIAPARALADVDLPAADNPLPRLLHQQGGLAHHELPRGSTWLFDIDTPTDATILMRHHRCPAEVRRVGAWEAEQGERLSEILAILATPDVELCIAGRVGAAVWSYLEAQSACRIRMLAEERGMQAAGRDVDGSARSALGFLYEELGPQAFFARLAELGSGIILDSRPLLAHLGLRPTAAERFRSDVYAWRDIAEPRLAAFTRGAADAPVPVLLGGHSVVAGGLWAMGEIAWQDR